MEPAALLKKRNYVADSMKGCYVIRPPYSESEIPIEASRFNPEEFGLKDEKDGISQVPDLLIDPESILLSVINKDTTSSKNFMITLTAPCLPVKSIENQPLQQGKFKDNENWEACVTFSIIVIPDSILDVGFLAKMPTRDEDGCVQGFYSDIQNYQNLPIETSSSKFSRNPKAKCVLLFPLRGPKTSFLCSQGFGGHFTHFFRETFYAIDFECPVGTPVVAVADGTVHNYNDQNSGTGILYTLLVYKVDLVEGCHAKNLYKWNSLMLKLDDGIYVEYVHIQQGSAMVKVGDRVRRGQTICLSGNVGFSPKPHLHIQAAQSSSSDAICIPFMLVADDDLEPFIPVAGEMYPKDKNEK